MPKTKPNETCPCGSGSKYKKCCQMQDAQQRLVELEELAPTEGHEASSDEVRTLVSHFCKYDIPVLDMSYKLNIHNLNSIYGANVKRRVCIVV